MEDARIGRGKIDDSEDKEPNVDSEKKEDNILCTSLKVDSKLEWNDFKDLLPVIDNKGKPQSENKLDVEVLPSPHILVQLSQKVYNIKEKAKSNETYERELELPEGWKFLTSAANRKNGYYGAAFWNSELRQLVIAHKGTKLASWNWAKDVLTDLKAVVFNNYAGQMSSAMTFADHVISTTSEVIGSNWHLTFTGHSLGGWLAQITCFYAKFLCRSEDHFIKRDGDGMHTRCVAFDSPGCADMLSKLTSDFDLRYDGGMEIDKLDVIIYLSAPNLVNTYNLHRGTLYRIFPDLSKLNSRQKRFTYTLHAHSIDKIAAVFVISNENIRILMEVTYEKIVDWPLTEGLCSKEEYDRFHKWALKDYHITNQKPTVKINERAILRYRTEKIEENCCKFAVFSSDEFSFLQCWDILIRENIVLSEIDKFTKSNKLSGYNELLPNYIINYKEKIFICVTKELLDRLINRTKNLLRLFPSLKGIVKDQLNVTPTAVQAMYVMASTHFLQSIKRCDVNFEDCFELQQFANDKRKSIMCIKTDDVEFDVRRIHNIFEPIHEENVQNSKLLEASNTQKRIIVLNWPQILNLNTHISSHRKLVTGSETSGLVIIAIPSGTDLNKDSEVVLEDLLSEIKNENSKKLIFLTSNKCALMSYVTSNYNEEELFYKDAEPVCFDDFTSEAQKKILEKPLLELHGIDFKLGQFFNVNDKHRMFDCKILKELAYKNTHPVKVESYLRDLCEDVSCVKLKISVPTENAVNFICNVGNVSEKTKANVFLIDIGDKECEDSEKIWKLLNTSNKYKEMAEKIKAAFRSKQIVTTRHQNAEIDFINLYRLFYDKRIYWLELRGDSVYWHYVYDKDFYIPRKFNHTFYLQPEVCNVISKKSSSDMLIFSNSSIEQLSNIFKKDLDTKRISVHFNDDDAYKKFEELKDLKTPVHLIRVENDTQKLIWVRSSGSMDSIRKYVNKKSDLIDEKDLSQMGNRIVLFSGEPGAGKSTIAFSLHKKMKSTWVIQMELKNCQLLKQLPSKLDIDALVSFLLYDNPTNSYSMAATLMKICLTTESSVQIRIIFDGFDEIRIAPDGFTSSQSKQKKNNQEKIIDLLEYLKEETTASIWITSRPFLSTIIENKLSIFSTEIEELYNTERTQLLYNIWSSRLSVDIENFGDCEEKFLKEYIDALFKTMELNLGKDISRLMGAPLQIWMIAEVAAPKTELFIIENGSVDSLQIQSEISSKLSNIYVFYQLFIEAKYDLYFEKSGLSFGLTFATRSWYIYILNRKHRNIAFQLLFPHEPHKFLGTKLLKIGDESVLDEERVLNAVGIIQSSYSGEFTFLHRTLAEFFVAELFISWLEKEDGRHQKYSSFEELLISEVLLDANYNIVRLFIDKYLSVRKLSPNVLNSLANCFWNICRNKRILLFDHRGQSLLHILSKENCGNIFEMFLNILDPTEYKEIKPESEDSYCFIRVCELFEKPHFFLADPNIHVDIISRFLQFLNNCSESFKKKIVFNTVNEMLEPECGCFSHCTIEKWLVLVNSENRKRINELKYHIFKNGNESVQEILSSIINKMRSIYQFLAVVEQGDVEGVKNILHESSDSEMREYFLSVRNKEEGGSALHAASRTGLQEMTECLLNWKAPLNVVDLIGSTPLHMAAGHGHLNIVKLLHTRGANIFHVNDFGMSAVIVSAMTGHLSVVQYFVENGVDINLYDIFGRTAFDYAVRIGHLEMVEWFMQQSELNHYSERWGVRKRITPDHLYRYREFTLRCRFGIKLPDYGNSRDHYLLYFDEWDVAKWLLENGLAQPGDLLHRAISKNQWEMAEQLIPLLPHEEASAQFPPEGAWVDEMKEAKQWRLMSQLIDKGAVPGKDALILLRKVLEGDESEN